MALHVAVDVDVSLCSSCAAHYYRNSCMWRRPIRLQGMLISQSHLVNTNCNLKFNCKSGRACVAAAAATSSQILSSMKKNFFLGTSASNNKTTITTTMTSLNCNDMIATTVIDTSSKEYVQQHQHIHKRQQPVLLFDVMDTIVRDPFYQDIPSFFRMSLKELIDHKHPTTWIDFELGFINEKELARNFFKDGRPVDLEGLKNCMRNGYLYVQGVEELLSVLKQNNYEMHALTNYPIWYEMIEHKLKLSTYLSWSFCSCTIGKRKPDLEFYAEVVRRLDVEPENCIFIDDRMRNVEAAVESGMVGLQFKDAKMLSYELSLLGIQTKSQDDKIMS